MPETDWQERFFRLERKHGQDIAALKDKITELSRSAEVRKEVHRDDILRTGMLIGALRQIRDLGGQAADIAESALIEAWGIVSVTQHCAEHNQFRRWCSECQRLNRGRPPVPGLDHKRLTQAMAMLVQELESLNPESKALAMAKRALELSEEERELEEEIGA